MSRGSKVGGTKRRVLDIVGFAAIVVLFLLYMVPFILVLLNSFNRNVISSKIHFPLSRKKDIHLQTIQKHLKKWSL